MLSRVADSLYWMSRYLERAEHTARVIDVQLSLSLERSGSDDQHWVRTLRSLGIEVADENAGFAYAAAQALIRDVGNASSIPACVAAARENARQVRELISTEMWEQLNRLFHSVREQAGEAEPREFLAAVKEGSHLFEGITVSTMTHGEGWYFIQAGRYLERLVSVATVVDEHFRVFPVMSDDAEHMEWNGLLRSCTGFEAYCKAYTAELRASNIAEFLVLHPHFPHSVRYAAAELEAAAKAISGQSSGRRANRVEQIAGRLHATLSFGQIDEIISGGISNYLESVLKLGAQFQSGLTQAYIYYPIEAALEA